MEMETAGGAHRERGGVGGQTDRESGRMRRGEEGRRVPPREACAFHAQGRCQFLGRNRRLALKAFYMITSEDARNARSSDCL